jgi:hypothetical protein
MKLYEMAREQGDSFEAGVKLAMKAVLVSPHFLFIGDLPKPAARGDGPQPLDEIALASRLSYFLWSSMPDDELLGLAERGQLRKNLAAQVKRMLASPKASRSRKISPDNGCKSAPLGTSSRTRKCFPITTRRWRPRCSARPSCSSRT